MSERTVTGMTDGRTLEEYATELSRGIEAVAECLRALECVAPVEIPLDYNAPEGPRLVWGKRKGVFDIYFYPAAATAEGSTRLIYAPLRIRVAATARAPSPPGCGPVGSRLERLVAEARMARHSMRTDLAHAIRDVSTLLANLDKEI